MCSNPANNHQKFVEKLRTHQNFVCKIRTHFAEIWQLYFCEKKKIEELNSLIKQPI